MMDLCYSVSIATIRKKEYPHPLQKNYLRTQLERRAWEKYGGPTGFKEALAKKQAHFLYLNDKMSNNELFHELGKHARRRKGRQHLRLM